MILWRDGVHPETPLRYANQILRSYKEDPPERYRLDYWMCFIANMLFSALGGKGEMPLPPWMRRENNANVSADDVKNMFNTVGIGVVADDGKHDFIRG